MNDMVNHPSHYGGDNVYEHHKVVVAWGLDYYLGNATKYLCRAGKKPGAETVQDLEKAIWYIKAEIEHIKATQHEAASAATVMRMEKDRAALSDVDDMAMRAR